MDEKNSREIPPHPEKKPRYDLPLTPRSLAEIFSLCADFEQRRVLPGLMGGFGCLTLCWLDGLVDGAAVSEDVLRPLTDARRVMASSGPAQLADELERGAAYACTVRRRKTTDECVADLLGGSCALIFEPLGEALTFETRTTLSRSVSSPAVEKAIKGGKDAFVETLRTNTSLVRRRLRTPSLKLEQSVVGRLSGTAGALL